MTVNGRSAVAWLRRARPLLGTLVDIGVPASKGQADQEAMDAAFAAIEAAQACLSRFDADSDVSRFHALACGDSLVLRPVAHEVLSAAHELHMASAGLFDISLGSAPDGWTLQDGRLIKWHAAARLDLGGIGKGHAVDLAVQALMHHGCGAGWVNAGGDLRVFGDVDAPVHLRDEDQGGVRAFATLRDGALATSAFGPGRQSRLHGGVASPDRAVCVSVVTARCLWADALTKIVACSGNTAHPLLARYGASAWLH